MAALARERSKDLEHKIEGTRETVGKILYHLTAADRLEWLFNNRSTLQLKLARCSTQPHRQANCLSATGGDGFFVDDEDVVIVGG